MKAKIELTRTEIEAAIRHYLSTQGYDVSKVELHAEVIRTGHMEQGREMVFSAEATAMPKKPLGYGGGVDMRPGGSD
jgi:hypothetical protein